MSVPLQAKGEVVLRESDSDRDFSYQPLLQRVCAGRIWNVNGGFVAFLPLKLKLVVL